MLGKLIKYDLKWILKLILIYCSLGIFFAVTGRLFGLIENSMFFDIISKVCNGISIAMLINAVVNAAIRGWVRVTFNLYKDESYLTHTLPIKKNTQFLSKILSILITMLIAVVVTIAGLIIMYLSKDTMEFLKTSLNIITDSLNTSIASLIITLSVLVFLQLVFITFSGVFGIVLGHTFNRKKSIYTVVIGFGTYMCASVIILLITLLLSVFNDNIYSILFGGAAVNVETLLTLSWVISAIYLVLIGILYFVTNKIFNKGVNIE